MKKQNAEPLSASSVVPTGALKKLDVEDVIPNKQNPRMLFDPEPLAELKKNIREHGVLVPITVYPAKAQNKYFILDGARRHRCCVELKKEGLELRIPANVVEPPTKIAGLLYMFSIHNFREQWELMPTALSLQIVINDIGESDTKALQRFTGLSEPQIERCKKLLAFPKRFQELSLDPDPATRIPSNFWIEALPVLELCDKELPALVSNVGGRDGVTDKLVEKYRAKCVKSVIHFRRIMEAYETAETPVEKRNVVSRLKEYILNTMLETRKAFDDFVMESRKVQSTVTACEDFIQGLRRLKLEFVVDRDQIRSALKQTQDYVQYLLTKLEGSDPPPTEQDLPLDEE